MGSRRRVPKKRVAKLVAEAAADRPIADRVAALEALDAIGTLPGSVLEVAASAAHTKPRASVREVIHTEDADSAARWNLIWRGIDVLGKLAERKDEAAAHLMRAARRDADAACQSLGLLGHSSPAVLGFLDKKLRSKDSRSTAAWALVRLGADPEPIAKLLAHGLRSKDEDTRARVAYDLAALQSPVVCRHLAKAASDRKWPVRSAAIESFERNGCACDTARGAVEAAKSDRAELVRRIADKVYDRMFG